MLIQCRKCRKVIGRIRYFDGILDGHCICGEPIRLCFTHSREDIKYQTLIDDYEVIWEPKENADTKRG